LSSSFGRQSQTTNVASVMDIQSLLARDTIAGALDETGRFRRMRNPPSTVEPSETDSIMSIANLINPSSAISDSSPNQGEFMAFSLSSCERALDL
jgi:hypothetical protein